MITSIISFREILQTLGQSITRPLPDFMEFVVMDAFLVLMVLYVFLFVRKIVKLVIRLVKRPGIGESDVSRRDLETAVDQGKSKAEVAQQLLASEKKTKNPFKFIGRLFGSVFGKLGGALKWLLKFLQGIVGRLMGLLRRKKAEESASAPVEAIQPTTEQAATSGVIPEQPDGFVAAQTVPTSQEAPAEPAPQEHYPKTLFPQTSASHQPVVAEQNVVQPEPQPGQVPPVSPGPPTSPAVETPPVSAPPAAEAPLPRSVAAPMPGSQPIAASTTDETSLTAAFEQELRDAQQAESQLHELKAKAASTALQKGSLAAGRSVEEALPWYEKAAELDPGSAEVQLGLSRLYKETGNLLGAFEAAQKAFAGTEDQQTRALALDGMDQVIVARSDETMVSREALAPPLVEPEPEPEPPPPPPKTLAEITSLLTADPDNPDLQRDLSIAYDEMGDGHAEHDNLIGALECFEASIMIVGRLVKAYPDELVYLRDFSVCQEKIGEIQNALGNREAAIAAYEESLPIVTMLANRFPDEEENLFDLKITKDRLAELKAQA